MFDTNIYTQDKLFLGTFFEMAWVFDDPQTVAIGICSDRDSHPFVNHPFVKQTIHAWAKTHEEAIEMVDRFIDIG